jgi:hypothetical protein
MRSCVIFLSLLFTVNGQCNTTLLRITCYGANVTVFPYPHTSVQHIEIIQTNISKIPNLKQWASLSSIEFRHNPAIDCNELSHIPINVHVRSDCDQPLLMEPEQEGLEYLVYLILLLPLSYLVAFVSRRQRLKNDYIKKNVCALNRDLISNV